MAYISSHKPIILETTASQLLVPTKHNIGDYLLIIVAEYSGTSMNSAGWTNVPITSGEMYYIKIISVLSSIDFNSASSRNKAWIATICGAHQVDFLDSIVPASITSVSGNGQSIVTNTDNALIITTNIKDAEQGIYDCPFEMLYCSQNVSYTNLGVAFTYQKTVGATPVPHYPAEATAGTYKSCTISIRDDGNNEHVGYHDTAATKHVEQIGMYPNNETQWASELVHASVTNSQPPVPFTANTDGTKTNGLSASAAIGFHNRDGVNLDPGSTTLNGLLMAGGFTLPASVDLSDSILSVQSFHRNTGEFLSQLGQIIGLSDGTNTRMWHISGVGALPNRQKGEYPFIFETEAGYELQNHGAVSTATLSNTLNIFTGMYAVDTYEAASLGVLLKVNEMPLVGGTVTKPSSLSDAFRMSNQYDTGLVQAQADQTEGQYLLFCKLKVGGSVPTFFNPVGQSIVFPSAYNAADGRPQCAVSAGKLGISVNLSDGDTYNMSGIPVNFGNFHTFEISVNTSKHATTTYNFNGNVNQFCSPILNSVGTAVKGLVISNSKEITYTDLLDMSGGCEVSKCVDAQAITIASEADFNKLHNCVFDDCSNVAIKIIGDQTGIWGVPNISFNGNVADIEYTGSTDFSIQSALVINVLNSGIGTLIAVTPTVDTGFNFTGLESGSQVVFFENGTTTEIQRNNATTNNEIWSELYTSDRLIDYTIMKVGFDPIRVVGVTAGNSVQTVAIQQKVARAYQSGVTFSYATHGSYNTVTNVFSLNVPLKTQEYYSAMVDAWISQANLVNTKFPITPNGNNSFSFDDATISPVSIKYFYRDAVRVTASGVTIKKYAAIWTSGTTNNDIAELQQVEAATPVKGWNAINQIQGGNVDMLLQVYEFGVYDYQNYLVIEYAKEGKYQGRAVMHDIYGTIEDDLYVVEVKSFPSPIIAADPALANPPVLTIHASPITWNTKPYSMTLTDSAAGNTGDDLAQWLNWNLRESNNALFQGQENFNLFDFIVDNSTSWETARGTLIGKGIVGCNVVENNGTTEHVDFTRHQSDDGTYYVKPITALGKITGLVSGSNVCIQNLTQVTVTHNAIVSGVTYSESYTDGTVYADGDILAITIAYQNGTTAKELLELTALVTSTGWSVIADQKDDDVYNINTIDGALVTTYSADYVNDADGLNIDIQTAGSTFSILNGYAWYVANLMTPNGILLFAGVMKAINAGHYVFDMSRATVRLDNIGNHNLVESSKALLECSDGSSPLRNPPTGGFGISMNIGDIYIANIGGSSLQPDERSKLLGIPSNPALDTDLSEVKTRLGLTKDNPFTNNVNQFTSQQGDIIIDITGDGVNSTTQTRQ